MKNGKMVERIYEFSGEGLKSYKNDGNYLKYLESEHSEILKDVPSFRRSVNSEGPTLSPYFHLLGDFYTREVLKKAFDYAKKLLRENKTKECVEKLEDLIKIKPAYDLLEVYALAVSNLSEVKSFKIVCDYWILSRAALLSDRHDLQGFFVPYFGMSCEERAITQAMFFSAAHFLNRRKKDSFSLSLLNLEVDEYLDLVKHDFRQNDRMKDYHQGGGAPMILLNLQGNPVEVDASGKQRKIRKNCSGKFISHRKKLREFRRFFDTFDRHETSFDELKMAQKRAVETLNGMLFTSKYKGLFFKSKGIEPLDFDLFEELIRRKRVGEPLPEQNMFRAELIKL